MHRFYSDLKALLIAVPLFIVTPLSARDIGEEPDSLEAAKVLGSRERMARMEGPVERMGNEQIRALGYADPGEALRAFSGISLRDYGGAGGLRTVSVRGFGAQHTQVSVDGIQLSDLQSGMADLAHNNFVKGYNIKVSIAGNEDIFKSASQMVAAGCVEMESVDPSFEKRPFSLGGMLRYGSFNTLGAQVFYDQRLTRRKSREEKPEGSRGVTLSAGLDYLGSDGDYPYRMSGDEELRRRAGSGVQRLSPEFGLKAELGAGALRAKVLADFAERGLPGAAVLHTEKATEHLSERHCAAAISFIGNDWGRWRLRSNPSGLPPEYDNAFGHRPFRRRPRRQYRLRGGPRRRPSRHKSPRLPLPYPALLAQRHLGLLPSRHLQRQQHPCRLGHKGLRAQGGRTRPQTAYQPVLQRSAAPAERLPPARLPSRRLPCTQLQRALLDRNRQPRTAKREGASMQPRL